MVFLTLDTRYHYMLGGNLECVHRFTGLPQENIEKHDPLDRSFRGPGFLPGNFLSFSRQMGLHIEAGDC